MAFFSEDKLASLGAWRKQGRWGGRGFGGCTWWMGFDRVNTYL